jgi:protein-S-isoprenylcysteine O-methyltransferase Ste14
MQFLACLARPWVDKTIAAIAIAPFVYVLHEQLTAEAVRIPEIVLMIHVAAVIATMLVRTPPARVTGNVLFWLLAFLATYWGFLTIGIYESGIQLAPTWLVYGLDLASLVVLLWARFSLGRSIGFVPAERSIVTTGAYAFVRHPIYTGFFLSIVALELASFTWRNLLLDAAWVALFIVKTFVEERFLSENPRYVEYMQSVRWRWMPGVA